MLLKTAAQAVHELAEERYPGVRVGMIYTLHPGGRDLGCRPRVHLVMTKGGMKDGQWVEIDKLPGGHLAAKWRRLLCKHLRKARPFAQKLRRAIDQGYRDHRGYQVHTDSFYPKGLDAAKYIGRYLGHPPLATSRITGDDGQSVTYWYVDSNAGLPPHTSYQLGYLTREGFLSRIHRGGSITLQRFEPGIDSQTSRKYEETGSQLDRGRPGLPQGLGSTVDAAIAVPDPRACAFTAGGQVGKGLNPQVGHARR